MANPENSQKTNDDFWDDPGEFISIYDQIWPVIWNLKNNGQIDGQQLWLLLDALSKGRNVERVEAMLRKTAKDRSLPMNKRRAIAFQILELDKESVGPRFSNDDLEFFGAYVALTGQDRGHVPSQRECVEAAEELTRQFNISDRSVAITRLWRIAHEIKEQDWHALQLPSNRSEYK